MSNKTKLSLDMSCKLNHDVFQLPIVKSEPMLYYVLNMDPPALQYNVIIDKDGNINISDSSQYTGLTIKRYAIIDDDMLVIPKQTSLFSGEYNSLSGMVSVLNIPATAYYDIKSTTTDVNRNYVDEIAFLADYYEKNKVKHTYQFLSLSKPGDKLNKKIDEILNNCQEEINEAIKIAMYDTGRQGFIGR